MMYVSGAEFLVRNELQNTPKLTETEYEEFQRILPERMSLVNDFGGYALFELVNGH